MAVSEAPLPLPATGPHLMSADCGEPCTGTWLSLTQPLEVAPEGERKEDRGGERRGREERVGERAREHCFSTSRQETYGAWGSGGWRSGKLSDVDTAEQEGLRSRQQRGQSIEKNQKDPKLG